MMCSGTSSTPTPTFSCARAKMRFIKEQVEEVATMSDLLAVVTRNRDDIEDIEEYVAREHVGAESDPTAPRAVGA